jgi:hypothetical protein
MLPPDLSGEHMPNYYFHLKYTDRILTDDEGSEFPNLPAAKREAQSAVRDMLVEAIRFRHKRVPDALIVADVSGQTLHTLPLAAVLPQPLKK